MPKGFPIASTSCPTRNLDESPRVATVRPLDGGVIFTASSTACSLLPASGGTVDTGPVPGCNVPTFVLAPPVDVLVLPNCQPANKPTPRTTRSTNDNVRIAPVRIPLERLGLTGGDVGSMCICPGRAWCGAVIGIAGCVGA